MSTDSVYKRAIKRVFAKKYHDGRMAFVLGTDDNTIHVIASLGHYVHKIASENEHTLEFVNSVGDRIVVALTNEERLQIERSGWRMRVPSLLTASINSQRT